MANYNKILKSTATYGTNKNYVESKTSSSSSPLTTKGDVYTFSTSGTRLPVGTNGYVLSADSSEATGLKWVAASSANYYLTALTFGTDSKLTGSMQDTTNITGNAMTTFTPVTTFVTGTKMGGNSSAAGYIQFLEDSSNGSHYTQIAGAASQAGNTTYTLPSAYPASNDYVLVSSTAGVMSWAENSASNYYTSSVAMGTDGILTGTIAGGGSNWTSTAFNVITDGQIAYGQSTSGLTTGSANFTFDGTKVDIAQTADDSALEIAGYDDKSGVTAKLHVRSNGLSRFQGSTDAQVQSAAGSIYLSSTEHMYLDVGTRNTYSHIFRDDTGEFARFKNARLGIGTTAPSYPLHVVQASGDTYGMYLFNSASRGIYFGDTSNDGSGYGKIGGVGGSLFLGSTQVYTSFIPTGDSNATLGQQNRRWSYFFTRFGQVGYDTSTTTTAQFGISGAADKVPLEVYANGATAPALHVTSGSLVGIGTTAPTQPLDVVTGDGVVIRRENTDSAIYGPSLYIDRKRATGGDLSSGDLIGNITFRPFETDYDNRAATISAAIEGTVTTDTTPGRLMFSTAAAGANTVSERMRITSDGYVGIGTTAPSEPLHVAAGDTGLAAYFTNTSSNGEVLRLKSTGDNVTMYIQTDHIYNSSSLHLGNSQNIYLRTDSAKLGVGTTNPKTEMSLVGSLTIKEQAAAGTDTADWGQIWVKNDTPNKLYFTDDAGTDFDLTLASTATGTILGTISDNYLPIGTAANTIGDFVLGLAENNSIWIGSDPTATTDTASKNVALGGTALDSITTGDSNVAIGYNAGTAVTTGGYSTYIGDMAGGLVTTTSYNNFIGYRAGYSATGQNQNNAMGHYALYENAGTNNVAIGHNTMQGEAGADNDQTVALGAYALRNISGSANQNVAVGYGALQGASTGFTGYQNVALGNYAGLNATTGYKNIIVGNEAGYDLTTGNENVIVGDQAGSNIIGGGWNVVIGSDAYKTATTGNYNIAIGKNAIASGLVTSDSNIAIGYDSLKSLTSGDSAVAIGAYALDAMTTANNNTAVGHSAGSGLVDGGANTLVGKEAGLSLTDQTHNTLIGYNAAIYNTGESNVAVGSSALKTGSNNYNVAIGQSAMTKVSGGAGGVAVGYQSGYHPTGNYNTWVGYNAGFGTAAASGYNNVGVGYETLMTITSGLENTAIGYFAGRSITSGPRNTIVGSRAADAIQTVDGVVAIGYAALGAGAGANYDVAIGYEAHYNGTSRGVFIGLQAGKETTGTGVAIGSEAGETNTSSSLVLIGHDAGKMVSGTAAGMTAIGHSVSTNASGTYHTMVGFQAGNTLKGNVNTGVGYKVLTSGTNAIHQNNVAIGYQTMQGANYSVTNQDNTAIGVNTLRYASGSSYNVAIGNYAMGAQDQEGLQNVAVGYYALSGATGANAVTAVGHLSARDLTTGDSHVAIGKSAMLKVTTSSYNTVVGVDALSDVDGAGSTTAVGFGAMKYSSADNATGIGQYALSGATGDKNAALGNSAGAIAKGSANSVMVGYQAGYHPTGNHNVWMGYKAGYGVVDSGAAENVGIGKEALLNITSAEKNVVIGNYAGYDWTTASESVAIGYGAGSGNTTQSRSVTIGYLASNTGVALGNVTIGWQAGKAQTSTSSENVIIGYNAGVVATASNLTVMGRAALSTMVTGNNQTAIGHETLSTLVSGASNTALGKGAGSQMPSGNNNVHIGEFTGRGNSSSTNIAAYNVYVGDYSGYKNEADQNIGIGGFAQYENTTGYSNVSVGYTAMEKNTTGYQNVALGHAALRSGTLIRRNVAVGYDSLRSYKYTNGTSTGDGRNIAMGFQSALNIEQGTNNVYLGTYAGQGETGVAYTGNVGIGDSALLEASGGNHNIAIGWQAMYGSAGNSTGGTNVAIGTSAMLDYTTAHDNVAIGYQAFHNSTTGDNNVAIGRQALNAATTQTSNTAIGHSAGYSMTESDNVMIGSLAGYHSESSGSTMVGFQAGYYPHGNHNTFIGYKAGKGDSSGVHTAHNNVAVGREAFTAATSAEKNTVLGTRAAAAITTQNASVIVGFEAGLNQQSGSGGNVALGHQALYSGTQNYQNTAVGINAGKKATGASSNNVYLGSAAGPSSTGAESNKLYIHNAEGTPLIAGDFSAGTVTIDGVLSATAKSFNIEHPLYKDKRLVHGSLEGPEHGIYIRGTIEASNGCEIELPDYWQAMCKDYTVQLTPHGPYTVFIQEKHKDKVMIASSSQDYKFDYFIVGKRTDETLEVVQDA